MRAFYQPLANGRRTISPMRVAWLTAIGLGASLAACSTNAPLGGGSGRPAATIEVHGGGGANGSSNGHRSPDGPVIIVAPVADASAADVAVASDGGASDIAALEHGSADGGADAGAHCGDAGACGRAPTSIAIGGDGTWQACALFNDGTVECWTNGVAADAPETTPVRVPGLAGATAISVGGENACALLGDGTVTCWVNKAGNQYAAPGPQLTTPAAVPGLAGVTALAVGELHSCAVVAGGAVKCWGVNNAGELGDGTTVDSATPVTVSVLDGAVAVAVGQFHSCALRLNGEVLCWGDNEQGYLGDGTAVSATTPENDGGRGRSARDLDERLDDLRAAPGRQRGLLGRLVPARYVVRHTGRRIDIRFRADAHARPHGRDCRRRGLELRMRDRRREDRLLGRRPTGTARRRAAEDRRIARHGLGRASEPDRRRRDVGPHVRLARRRPRRLLGRAYLLFDGLDDPRPVARVRERPLTKVRAPRRRRPRSRGTP